MKGLSREEHKLDLEDLKMAARCGMKVGAMSLEEKKPGRFSQSG